MDQATSFNYMNIPSADETMVGVRRALTNATSRWEIRNALRTMVSSIWKDKDMSFTFLVAGKTGEGKSSLINSLVGRKVCDTDAVSKCTTTTTLIAAQPMNGVQVSIYDTQGFQDGMGQDREIFGTIQDKRINLLLLCVSMLGRAEQADTKETIAMITRELGGQIWNRTVVVFTKANMRAQKIERRDAKGEQGLSYKEVIQEYERVIRGYISASRDVAGHVVPESTMEVIPFVPAGHFLENHNELRKLPDCPDWMSRLWLSCFVRCDSDRQAAFLSMAQERLQVRQRAGSVVDYATAVAQAAVPGNGHDRPADYTEDGSEHAAPANKIDHEPSSHARKEETKRGATYGATRTQTGATAGVKVEARAEEASQGTHGAGAFVTLDEKEMSLVARATTFGTEIGSKTTGCLGYALLAAAKRMDDGKGREAVTKIGKVLAGVTGAPGALAGGAIGGAIGGALGWLRKLLDTP